MNGHMHQRLSSHASKAKEQYGTRSRKRQAAASALPPPAAPLRASARYHPSQELPSGSNLATLHHLSVEPLDRRQVPQAFDAARDHTAGGQNLNSGRSGVRAPTRSAPFKADNSTLEPSSHYDTASSSSRLVGGDMVEGLDPRQSHPEHRHGDWTQTSDGPHTFLPMNDSRPGSQASSRPGSRLGLRPATGPAHPSQAHAQRSYTPIREPSNAPRVMTAPEGPSTSSQSFKRPETPQIADVHGPLEVHVRNQLRETKRFGQDVQEKFAFLMEEFGRVEDFNKALDQNVSKKQEDLADVCQAMITSQADLQATLRFIRNLVEGEVSKVTQGIDKLLEVLKKLPVLEPLLEQVSASVDRIERAQASEFKMSDSRHKQLSDNISKVSACVDRGVERISAEVKRFADQESEFLRTECHRHEERIERCFQKYDEERKMDDQRHQQRINEFRELLLRFQPSTDAQLAQNFQFAPLGQTSFAPRRIIAPSTPVTLRGTSPALGNDQVMRSDTGVRDSDWDSALDNHHFGLGQDPAGPARDGERRSAAEACGQHAPRSRQTASNLRAFPVRDDGMEEAMESRPPSPALPPLAAESSRKKRGRQPAESAAPTRYGRRSKKRVLPAEGVAEGQVDDGMADEAEGKPEAEAEAESEPKDQDLYVGPSTSRAATRGRRRYSTSSARAANQASVGRAGVSRRGEDPALSSKPTTKSSKRPAAKRLRKLTARKTTKQKRRKFDTDDDDDDVDVDKADYEEGNVGNDGGGDKHGLDSRTKTQVEAFGGRYPTRARRPTERYGATKK